MKLIYRLMAAGLILCTVLTFAVSCAGGADGDGNDYSELQDTVTVGVADGENYTVTSQNPMRVSYGATASFRVSFDEGYEFGSASDGAEFGGGILTVKNVQFPTTVNLFAKKTPISADIIFPDDPTEDEPTEDAPTDDPTEDEPTTEDTPPLQTVTVQLSAKPDDGYKFICWSLDRPITEGGEVFATEAAGSFEIPVGCVAQANYVEVGYDVILYRMNGGTVRESGADFYYQTVSNKHYYLPNTLHESGRFVRDGHILCRYTENADGSGKYTTLGGNIEPDKNGFVELYLYWAPITQSGLSFNLAADGEGGVYAELVAYTGGGGKVVIPDRINARIDGKAQSVEVKRIKASAFEKSNISSLVLPSTVHTVEPDAFKDCTLLKEVTLFDNFYEIKDEAFSGCKIPQIYLNAARLPSQTQTALGMNAYKYDRLRLAAANGEKLIVVFAGSSSRYGFLAEEMQKAFDGEYRVINFGNNSQIPAAIYMEAFLSFFGEGDVVIHAPETTAKAQMGDFTLNYLTFMGSEGMLEIFSYVDMTSYPGFFSALTVFNQEKRNTSPTVSYEAIGKDINEYTDLTSNKDNPSFKTDRNDLYPFNTIMITERRAKALSSIYQKVRGTGAKMYLSFAPINVDSCCDEAKSKEAHDKYLEKIAEMIDVTVITNPADCFLENRHFNDSNYHPDPEGAKIRTDRLTADLKAQLEKETDK